VQRVKEAVSEIKQVARPDRILAAEGAVVLLERLSRALEQVDSSSGAIGTAVNHAIADLVPIIAGAHVDDVTRQRWLERLWAAHEVDQVPYIESLTEYWGDLCGSKGLASAWADEVIGITRMALSPDKGLRGHFHGTCACLSALYRAERYEDIVELLEVDTIWSYKRWGVRALAAMGRKSDAIRYAEACRGHWTPEGDVDAICEEILLSSGLIDEAYRRYGLRANRRGTYLATFRAIAKKYPQRTARVILEDLVESTPGEEGKWFAAAKEAALYDEALALASRSPCDPKTLTRAARDLADTQPAFALEIGLLALRWLVEGYGYEVTGADVWAAYFNTMRAAEKQGDVSSVQERVREVLAHEPSDGFVRRILGRGVGV